MASCVRNRTFVLTMIRVRMERNALNSSTINISVRVKSDHTMVTSAKRDWVSTAIMKSVFYHSGSVDVRHLIV